VAASASGGTHHRRGRVERGAAAEARDERVLQRGGRRERAARAAVVEARVEEDSSAEAAGSGVVHEASCARAGEQAFAGQALRELRARPRKRGAHGADVDAADLRRLGIGKLGELAEDEHVAVVGRDGGERARTFSAARCAAALERRVAVDVSSAGACRREVSGSSRPRGDRGLAREVARDAAEPRAERAARGSYWSVRVMKWMNVSWVTSAACAVEPQ
jgi:hypothetical protein